MWRRSIFEFSEFTHLIETETRPTSCGTFDNFPIESNNKNPIETKVEIGRLNVVARKKSISSQSNMGDFVQVNVSNNQNDVVSFEKRFPKDVKIAELKVFISFADNYIPSYT